jgi:hypothetical protein
VHQEITCKEDHVVLLLDTLEFLLVGK